MTELLTAINRDNDNRLNSNREFDRKHRILNTEESSAPFTTLYNVPPYRRTGVLKSKDTNIVSSGAPKGHRWLRGMDHDDCVRSPSIKYPFSRQHHSSSNQNEAAVTCVWQPSCSVPLTSSTDRCCSFVSVVLVSVLVLMTSTNIAIAASLGGSDQRPCEYQMCWDLYQLANSELLVQDSFISSYKPQPHHYEGLCIALRTFSVCINNLTYQPGCLGNLNYHSAKMGIESQMKSRNCSRQGPVFNPSDTPSREPQAALPCTYTPPEGQSENKRHCSLFGDPHLHMWNGVYQTCKVQGAWPLIDNEYLTVQVTNEYVASEPRATATTRITVVVKQSSSCLPDGFVTYQAQTDHLPATFDTGDVVLGLHNSVSIKEVTPGSHVEIYIRYISATLVVRQVGMYLTFSASMPETFTAGPESVTAMGHSNGADRLQLCLTGCPFAERINYQCYIAQHKPPAGGPAGGGQTLKENAVIGQGRTGGVPTDRGARITRTVHNTHKPLSRPEAEVKCRSVGVVGFYYDSCVFDLLTTSDSNFTLAAFYALQDVQRLTAGQQPNDNHTTVEHCDELCASGATRTTSTTHLWTITVYLSVVYLWRHLVDARHR